MTWLQIRFCHTLHTWKCFNHTLRFYCIGMFFLTWYNPFNIRFFQVWRGLYRNSKKFCCIILIMFTYIGLSFRHTCVHFFYPSITYYDRFASLSSLKHFVYINRKESWLLKSFEWINCYFRRRSVSHKAALKRTKIPDQCQDLIIDYNFRYFYYFIAETALFECKKAIP